MSKNSLLWRMGFMNIPVPFYAHTIWQNSLLWRLGFWLLKEGRHSPPTRQGRSGGKKGFKKTKENIYIVLLGSSSGPCHHWHCECQWQGGGGGGGWQGSAEVEEVSWQNAQVWETMRVMLFITEVLKRSPKQEKLEASHWIGCWEIN